MELTKLRPDRDLQCYFERPSAVAALSEATENGFTVSGCWRQQFDWAVVEWNRDNVFEHRLLRNLPDGDLSGLHLTYEESRDNCIPIDSTLYPTTDWPYLRIWDESNGEEQMYSVPLRAYATPVSGDYAPASTELALTGLPAEGDYIELAWLDQHFNYQIGAGDTLDAAAAALAAIITGSQSLGRMTAVATGNRLSLTYLGDPGANGNRVGVYGMTHGARTESWDPWWRVLDGGRSPERWRIDLDFSNLRDVHGALVPTTNVRKMRWTWAADTQREDFVRSEFSVTVSNWTVSGERSRYQVAGPGSWRIEDTSSGVSYGEGWTEARGNYSGGAIRWSRTPGSWARCEYRCNTGHMLYLGTRRAESCGSVTVQIDDFPPSTIDLRLAAEDVLVRIPLGAMGEGQHTVLLTHTGAAGSYAYFDYVEIAAPCSDLPRMDVLPTTTLATDWDTDHSIALAPERTAWLIDQLGFHGRANHFAGALWFYELRRDAHRYATASITFSGAPEWSRWTRVNLGPTAIEHLNLIGDTAETIAKSFELLINGGATGLWAKASGSVLTLTSKIMGGGGNGLSVSAITGSTEFTAECSAPAMTGGLDGRWVTDLASVPRLNRAARDWTRSFLRALDGAGIRTTVAFSMELQHGDDNGAAGIAQRYPDGAPAWLNTPALQTNFGPESTAFWKQAYRDMAQVMMEAGVPVSLQLGEVQWWYFANASGMPFYDEYTTSTFAATYQRPMPLIASEHALPEQYAEACAFLAGLIGRFTSEVMSYVRQTYPTAQFEVLYAPDVNDTPLNRIINYPAEWSPAALSCLKTENFTYTGNRDLNKARESIQLPRERGFSPRQSSHLIGISDYTTPWERERRLAMAEGVESVVLFALDQFCLIGYDQPGRRGGGKSRFMGA